MDGLSVLLGATINVWAECITLILDLSITKVINIAGNCLPHHKLTISKPCFCEEIL